MSISDPLAPLSVADAAYNLVHDYPGGAVALAPRLGKSHTTLSHEVDGNLPNAKFGLLDAMKCMHFANDNRLMFAIVAERGFLPPLPMPRVAIGDATEGELMAKAAALSEEMAILFGALHKDLADGRIKPAELRVFEKDALDTVQAVVALVGAMRAKAARDAAEAKRPPRLHAA